MLGVRGLMHTAAGTLAIDPPGEYGDYVRRTVEAENADRLALMKQLAAERRVPLPQVEAENADRLALMKQLAAERRVPMAEIETEQANLWRERAFPGEWIETQVDGTWRWEQKQGG